MLRSRFITALASAIAATWNIFRCQRPRGRTAPLLASSANDLPNATCQAKTHPSFIVLVMIMATMVMLLEGYGCVAHAEPQIQIPHFALVETVGVSDVTEDILNPDQMFKDFGFVSSPVLGVTMKAFFNFFVQIALLVGMAIYSGRTSITARFLQEPAFGKLSIAFQIVGQCGALFAFISLALSTRCWEKFGNWQRFSLGVSQHSSTITIIVGLANNGTMSFWAGTPCQRKIAKTLVVTGLIVGLPIWSATAVALVSWGGLLPCAVFGLELVELVVSFLDPQEDDSANSSFYRMASLVAGNYACLALVVSLWFILGVWRHPFYATMLLGATVIELLLPLFLLLMLLYLPGGEDFVEKPNTIATLFWTFALALLNTYMVTMSVPTCILTQRDPGYFFTGAVLSFWGKNIKKYFTVSFVYPAMHQIRNAASGAHFVNLWLSQLFGLIS